MIENVKLNSNSRSSLLTFNLDVPISIKTLIAIKKLLEQEISVAQKVKVNLKNVKERKEDLEELILQFEKEKHPILHRYISMKALQE
jgi:hypothetical protein